MYSKKGKKLRYRGDFPSMSIDGVFAFEMWVGKLGNANNGIINPITDYWATLCFTIGGVAARKIEFLNGFQIIDVPNPIQV